MTAAPTLETESDVIDYDTVYASYLSALVDKLRGLSAQVDYLDLWVPDEDPLASVRNMLDSAATLGARALRVRLGAATVAKLDRDALLRMAQNFGTASLSDAAGSVLLAVVQLRLPARVAEPNAPAPEAISGAMRSVRPVFATSAEAGAAETHEARDPADVVHEAYRARLHVAAQQIEHQGALSELHAATDILALTVTDTDVGLQLLVDASSHAIRQARFTGPTSLHEGALLDQFCGLLEGLPLLEARDHAVLRLEHQLRDRNAPAPVRGIVSPEAVGGFFERPRRLIRAAFECYRERSGYVPGVNRHYPQPRAEWLALDAAARRKRVEALLADHESARGEADARVQLAEIRDDVRIILNLPRAWTSAERQQRLMRLEDALKAHIDPRLEVFAEELKDQNKKRRLAVVEPIAASAAPERTARSSSEAPAAEPRPISTAPAVEPSLIAKAPAGEKQS